MLLLVEYREDIPIIYKKIQVRLFTFVILVLLLAACAPVEAPPSTDLGQTQIQPTPTLTPVPSLSPPARGYYGMAYDAESDRAILFGGIGKAKGMLEDTWAYDLSANSWRKMAPAQSPPPGHGPMAYDIQSDRVILFFDTRVWTSATWAYDHNTDTWVNMQPTEAPFGFFGARMVYDAESDRVILFGGMDARGGFRFFDDTWAYDFDSNNWTKMKPAASPPGRNYYPMAYDASSDRIVLFGADPGGINDMWSYDYNADTWEELKPGETPSLRLYCDMVYDAQSDRMILFGGTMLQGMITFGDTWAYHLDTDTWTELKPATSPGKRGWYASVYSTKAERVILFGGGTTRSTFGNETWIYDPKANVWTNVTPSP